MTQSVRLLVCEHVKLVSGTRLNRVNSVREFLGWKVDARKAVEFMEKVAKD